MDIYDRIQSLLDENNMTAYQLSKQTGISTGLLSQWKQRTQEPSNKKLQIIANFFNVSLNYLSGLEELDTKKAPSEDEVTFDDFTYAMNEEAHDLTEEEKNKLLELAKFFREQRHKE